MSIKKKFIYICALAVMLALCIFGFSACDFPGTDGKNKAVFEVSKDGETITGLTEYGKTLTEIEIPETLNNRKITSIGIKAFYNCASITNITIPDCITDIKSEAFHGCDNLTSVYYNGTINEWVQIGGLDSLMRYGLTSKKLYIDDELATEANITTDQISSYAFYNCSSITNVTFSCYYCIGYIGERAFQGCTALTSVTISLEDATIGDYTFEGCTALTSVTIENNVQHLGKYAFANCSALTEIKYNNAEDSLFLCSYDGRNHTFYNAGTNGTGIKVTIGKNVKIIPEHLFAWSAITEVVFEEGSACEIIGSHAFEGCTMLTDITIRNGVKSICEYSFANCSSLTNIVIPDGVKWINNLAFNNCSSLTSVTIGNSVTSIGLRAFSECKSLTSVSIGSGVKSIEDYAFWNCDSLTSIYYGGTIDEWAQINFGQQCANPLQAINSNLYIKNKLVTKANITTATKINDMAFIGCKSLTSVTFGNSVKSIGDSAFSWCTALTSVTLGNNIESIGMRAFNCCDNLTSVTFENPNGWFVSKDSDASSGIDLTLTSPSTNAYYLTNAYSYYYWKRG